MIMYPLQNSVTIYRAKKMKIWSDVHRRILYISFGMKQPYTADLYSMVFASKSTVKYEKCNV